MSDYPNEPGSYGLGGSDEAARRMKSVVGRQHQMVMSVIEAAGAQGVTGDEIAARLDWDKYAVRPRTAELRKAGKILDSQKRRPSLTGINSIVWIAAAHSHPVKIGEAA